jgi:hypothetical protein
MILSLNRVGEVMQGFVQGADRQQTTLLPECLDDWVDEGNSIPASARRSCGCLRRGTGGWRWGLVDRRRSRCSARSGITRNVRSVPRSPREYSNRQHDYSDNGERSKVLRLSALVSNPDFKLSW